MLEDVAPVSDQVGQLMDSASLNSTNAPAMGSDGALSILYMDRTCFATLSCGCACIVECTFSAGRWSPREKSLFPDSPLTWGREELGLLFEENSILESVLFPLPRGGAPVTTYHCSFRDPPRSTGESADLRTTRFTSRSNLHVNQNPK